MHGMPGASGPTAPDRLSHELDRLIAESGAQAVAVAYRDVAPSTEVLINPDEPFHPASVFKICVLMELYRRADAGDLDLDARIPVANAFSSIADGSPFMTYRKDDAEPSLYDRVGETATLRELGRLMVVASSNLATNILIAHLGAAAVTTSMAELGAPDLVIRRGPEDNVAYGLGLNNVVTARGLLAILDRLARLEVGAPGSSREMIEILAAQAFNEGIPAALPADVRVAHKTGWNERLYHDAAIVMPPSRPPYVLVVLTRGLDEATAGPALVRAISDAVFRHASSMPGTSSPV